jgi:hypothetical protein
MVRLLIFLLLLNFSSVCQTTNSWFRIFKGNIDKYPVTLHIHKAGNDYRGFYYYDSQQRPIDIFGNDTAYNGSIGLIAYTSKEDNELFRFIINNDSVNGTWKKTADSQPLNFTAKAVESPLTFTYVYTEGSVRLRADLENSPEASYSAASVWPTGNNATNQFLKKMITNIFKDGYDGNEEIGRILLNEKKHFFATYVEENKDVTDQELSEISIGYNNEMDSRLMICYQSENIVSLAHFTYSFTGGAHGNYGTSYTVIDLKEPGKLELKDFINAGDHRRLNQLLEKNFRKQYGLKPNQSLQDGGLFENKIEANENFYVTGKGIGFCFNPYEIGPYVMGEINIFIPFSELPASPGRPIHQASAQGR